MKESKNVYQIIVLLLFAVMGVACNSGPKTVDAETFIRWVNNPENGLIQQKKIDHFTFSIQYQPAELIALRELKSRKNESWNAADLIRFMLHAKAYNIA